MKRLNITLDDAGSLLSAALDQADADAVEVTELLDGIPGALERARLGSAQGRAGDVIPLDDR